MISILGKTIANTTSHGFSHRFCGFFFNCLQRKSWRSIFWKIVESRFESRWSPPGELICCYSQLFSQWQTSSSLKSMLVLLFDIKISTTIKFHYFFIFDFILATISLIKYFFTNAASPERFTSIWGSKHMNLIIIHSFSRNNVWS